MQIANFILQVTILRNNTFSECNNFLFGHTIIQKQKSKKTLFLSILVLVVPLLK